MFSQNIWFQVFNSNNINKLYLRIHALVAQMELPVTLDVKKCVHSREAFKAYCSLGTCNYFPSGKVKSILTDMNENTCVVYGEIEAGWTLSPHGLFMMKNGKVQCGHCIWMAW